MDKDTEQTSIVPAFVLVVLRRFYDRSRTFPEWEVSGAFKDAKGNQPMLSEAEHNGYWAELAAFLEGEAVALDRLESRWHSVWLRHRGVPRGRCISIRALQRDGA